MKLATTPTPEASKPSAVYLLPHVAHRRFKIGWSMSPTLRIRNLPEHDDGELDLASAQLAWFSVPMRAQQVECSLHRGLAPYQVKVAHRGDGHTEWFDCRALDLARQMLVMLTTPERTLARSVLRGLDQGPHWDPSEQIDTEGPEGVWSRVEDLWWRLTTYLPLAVDIKEGELRWRGMKRLQLPETHLLRSRAVDLETYQWRDAGRRRSIVSLMDWDGDDLLQRLTLPREIRRWPSAEGVAGSLQAFLHRQALAQRP